MATIERIKKVMSARVSEYFQRFSGDMEGVESAEQLTELMSLFVAAATHDRRDVMQAFRKSVAYEKQLVDKRHQAAIRLQGDEHLFLAVKRGLEELKIPTDILRID